MWDLRRWFSPLWCGVGRDRSALLIGVFYQGFCLWGDSWDCVWLDAGSDCSGALKGLTQEIEDDITYNILSIITCSLDIWSCALFSCLILKKEGKNQVSSTNVSLNKIFSYFYIGSWKVFLFTPILQYHIFCMNFQLLS